MKRAPEHKVVAIKLDARDVAGDAVLVENLMAKMVADGWDFISLATPTGQTALVVFSRPGRAGAPESTE